jgi:hypothetical protein
MPVDDYLTLKEAEDEIDRLTDELEAKRDMMSDADFMNEVTIYKNKCEETYQKLDAIAWLTYKRVNICGFVVRFEKTPIVHNAEGLDDQSIKALVYIAETAKLMKEKIDVDDKDVDFQAEKIKIKGMRNAYKVCFHTKVQQ